MFGATGRVALKPHRGGAGFTREDFPAAQA